jgi:hypothetical protein
MLFYTHARAACSRAHTFAAAAASSPASTRLSLHRTPQRTTSTNATRNSWFFENWWRPVYRKIVPFVFPVWMHPNIVTIIGGVATLLHFLVTGVQTDWFTTHTDNSPLLWTIGGLLFAVYMTCDNCDGIQARRVKVRPGNWSHVLFLCCVFNPQRLAIFVLRLSAYTNLTFYHCNVTTPDVVFDRRACRPRRRFLRVVVHRRRRCVSRVRQVQVSLIKLARSFRSFLK